MMHEAAEFPGEPDGFQRLWTPHRAAYVGREKEPSGAEPDCPFCAAPKGSDADGLIVARGEHTFCVLNLFPYNAGHLLVCTYRHVADYAELTAEERVEMGEMTAKAMTVIRAAMNPAGFNLGMNQGQVAGAGIAAHIHQHVVPRWLGDANFFPIVGRTKAVPALLADTREQLAKAWSEC